MTGRRERPTDAEIGAWVADVRGPVLSHAVPRRRWWRLSRPLVVGSVVGAVAAGGIAYAAVERTRAGVVPEIRSGNSVVEIGKPAVGDRFLNLSMTYRCRKGEKISVRDATHELMSGGCSADTGEAGLVSRGLSGSRPVEEIHGTKLTVTSDISREYRVDATWGPRASMPVAQALPEIGPDGRATWDVPRYRVNEFGLTVGNRMTMNTPESAWPDLIPTTYRGEQAYFRKQDMLGEMAGNPEEAVRQMRERREQGLDIDGELYQFVYAADGRTRLGKVHVGSVSSN